MGMFDAFRTWPIRRKLMLVLMSTVLVSLALVMIGIMIYEFSTHLDRTGKTVREIGGFIAANSAPPLAFDDRQTADEILGTLQSAPQISIAALYTPDNRLFASYLRGDPSTLQPPEEPGRPGLRTDGMAVIFVRPITQKGQLLGTLYLRTDIADLASRFKRYAGIFTIAALAIGAGAFLLQILLHKMVTEPLLQLGRFAERIAEGDLEAKAQVTTNDEIGQLARTFNHMTAELTRNVQVIKDNELRRQLAIDSADLGIYEWNLLTGDMQSDQRMKAQWGLPPDANVSNEMFLEAIHPEDQPKVKAALRQVMHATATSKYLVEFRLIGIRDRVLRWIVATGLICMVNGRLVRLIGATLDITERKQAEAALRESEEKYRSLFNSIDEGFALCEILMDVEDRPVDYRYLEANPAFERNMGITIENALGRTIRQLIPDIEDFWIDTFIQVVETRTPIRFVHRIAQLDRWFDVYAFPRRGARFAMLFTDVSAAKKIEENLRKAHEDLERKVHERTAELENRNREIRELAHKTIAAMENDRRRLAKDLHDSIGGTLAAIKYQLEGRVEEMRDPPQSAYMPLEKIIDYLSEAVTESRRITKQLRPSVLDDFGLAAAVEEYIKDFKRFHPDIDIALTIGSPDLNLPADTNTVIYRILQEALNNIGKHSRATRVNIQLRRLGSTVHLEVKDNGIGFDVGATTGRREALTNYGLHSMKERADLCRGDFQIESEPGKGTRIKVAIPVAAKPHLMVLK